MEEIRAISKYLRTSPQKVRRLIHCVKGKPVQEGLNRLKFMPQKAAGLVEKTVTVRCRQRGREEDGRGFLGDNECLCRSGTLVEAVQTARPRPGLADTEKNKSYHGDSGGKAVLKKGEDALGQKVNPLGLRLGITRTWDSRWYADKEYADFILEDFKLREFVKTKLKHAGIEKVEIERSLNRIKIRIFAARPGIVIGKKGTEIEQLKDEIKQKVVSGKDLSIDIQEVKKPEIVAQLVAENVASQLERRVAFRRAMKRGVSASMKFGAKGIKIICSGRLGGAEMARREWYKEGRVPLHTLRADIDYGFVEAKTTYGLIGVKVFMFKGEVMKKDQKKTGLRSLQE